MYLKPIKRKKTLYLIFIEENQTSKNMTLAPWNVLETLYNTDYD